MAAGIFPEALLAPLDEPDGSPCGADLEYAPRFLAFMNLARGVEEQQLGDSVLPPREPDWREVWSAGLELLAETRDLRLVPPLARAALHIKGIEGFAQALELALAWLERFWEHVHPRLEIDGEHDPLMRSNALAALSDPHGAVKSLRQAVFIEGPLGAVSFSEAERLLNGKAPDAGSLLSSSDQLTRMIVDDHARNEARFAALGRARTALNEIRAITAERLDSEYWPNVEVLEAILERLGGLVARTLATPDPAAGPDVLAPTPTGDSPAPPPTSPPGGAGLPATVGTRAEAFRALALARGYFERHEPSHPAPLLIRRIERLAELDFWDIVKDLTPGGLAQLQAIAGIPDEAGG